MSRAGANNEETFMAYPPKEILRAKPAGQSPALALDPGSAELVFYSDRLADYVRMHFATQPPDVVMPEIIAIALRDYREARARTTVNDGLGLPLSEERYFAALS
jgi:hypothetical protein